MGKPHAVWRIGTDYTKSMCGIISENEELTLEPVDVSSWYELQNGHWVKNDNIFVQEQEQRQLKETGKQLAQSEQSELGALAEQLASSQRPTKELAEQRAAEGRAAREEAESKAKEKVDKTAKRQAEPKKLKEEEEEREGRLAQKEPQSRV